MIFLSYSRADAPLVEVICEGLRARGVDIWLDRAQLRVGEPWLGSIASAIERSESVIVVSSQYSVASPHVQWEHQYAVSHARKPVNVVQIDNGAHS
jgi:TIR domain